MERENLTESADRLFGFAEREYYRTMKTIEMNYSYLEFVDKMWRKHRLIVENVVANVWAFGAAATIICSVDSFRHLEPLLTDVEEAGYNLRACDDNPQNQSRWFDYKHIRIEAHPEDEDAGCRFVKEKEWNETQVVPRAEYRTECD